jgi:predicted MPP superfamily phosphohydrolase
MHFSFHTILFLSYTIPGIYLFIRIWQLFVPREFVSRYILIFLLVSSIYPLTLFLDEGSVLSSFLSVVAGYLLPFYLYLFLSLLLLDIFLLINLIFRIIPRETLRTCKFRRFGLVTILVIDLLVVTGGIINFNTIRVSDYHIDIPGRSSDLKHLRIAFAADFHLKEGTGICFVRRFHDKIVQLQPDIIIFGGDVVEGDEDDGNLYAYASILKDIPSRFGSYGVLGNHEYYSGQDNGNFFTRSGIKILNDTTVSVGGNFILAGRLDGHSANRKTVKELLLDVPDSLPLILVDHRPVDIDNVAETSADIQLSGHTHNGQMFPINLITRKVYQLSWGHMKKGNTHFFVTSGIRLWGPPVRTAGKSEIMVIDVDFTH